MNKYKNCKATFLLRDPLKILYCVLRKHHDGQHTDGEQSW